MSGFVQYCLGLFSIVWVCSQECLYRNYYISNSETSDNYILNYIRKSESMKIVLIKHELLFEIIITNYRKSMLNMYTCLCYLCSILQ